MLSPAIARELRARGHDAEAVAGHPDRETLSDPEVLTLARAEHRAVITNNLRDFRPLHHEAISPGGHGHYGIIFIPGTYRRTRNDTGKIITALETLWSWRNTLAKPIPTAKPGSEHLWPNHGPMNPVTAVTGDRPKLPARGARQREHEPWVVVDHVGVRPHP